MDVEELTPEQAAAIRSRADRRLDTVRELFPPGSWEHEEPIVLESRGMRLLFKQYHSTERREICPARLFCLMVNDEHIRRMAVLFVTRLSAVLEFDEPLDLRWKAGSSVGGSLRGQVTIRDSSSVGANDDIELVTRSREPMNMKFIQMKK